MLHIVSRTARKNPAVVYILPMETATEFIRARIGGMDGLTGIANFLKMNSLGSGSIKVPFDTDDFLTGTLEYLRSQCRSRAAIFTAAGELLAIDQRGFTITVNNLWDALPHIDNVLSLNEQLLTAESKQAADELEEADDALADARTDYEEAFSKMFVAVAPGELHKIEGEWTLRYFANECEIGDVLLRRKQLYIRNI